MKKQLGAILVENGVCTPAQVEVALDLQRTLAERKHYKHLGAILLEMGLINLRQLHRALEGQNASAAST